MIRDFKPELRKAVPIIVREEDLARDKRIFFMVNLLQTLKRLVPMFEYECLKDDCKLPHCCKPCNAWTFNTEVVLERDLAIMGESYSGDPLNAFYTADAGCTLPVTARPVNCLVFACPRMHPIERTMFDALVGTPLKAVRRFIWEYDRAPTPEYRQRIYQQVVANYDPWPGIVIKNLERYETAAEQFQQALDMRSDG